MSPRVGQLGVRMLRHGRTFDSEELQRSIIHAMDGDYGPSYEDGLVMLDFNGFCDVQSIFKLNSKVPDRAVHLGVTWEEMNGSKVSPLLVNLSNLDSPDRVSAIRARLKADRCHPVPYDPRILTGRRYVGVYGNDPAKVILSRP